MKIIVEIYWGEAKQSAWLVDTQNLDGHPPVIRIQLQAVLPKPEKATKP